MRVPCEITETTLTNENGREIDGVVACCRRCLHQTESYGTGENSRKRCLVLMREECPEYEDNFYVDEDEG